MPAHESTSSDVEESNGSGPTPNAVTVPLRPLAAAWRCSEERQRNYGQSQVRDVVELAVAATVWLISSSSRRYDTAAGN